MSNKETQMYYSKLYMDIKKENIDIQIPTKEENKWKNDFMNNILFSACALYEDYFTKTDTKAIEEMNKLRNQYVNNEITLSELYTEHVMRGPVISPLKFLIIGDMTNAIQQNK